MGSTLFIIGIVTAAFAFVPMITIPPEAFGEYLDVVFEVLSTILYVLPAGTIWVIFTLVVSLQIMRIVIAFIKMIWDLLPLL